MLYTAEHEAQMVAAVRNVSVATKANSLPVPATDRLWRHNPYNTKSSIAVVKCTTYAIRLQDLPSFWREVTFAEIEACATNPPCPKHAPRHHGDVARVFIGQVPFWLDELWLQRIIEVITGVTLLGLRPHIRRDGTGQKSGAWFADVLPEDADRVSVMNRRSICTEQGVCLFHHDKDLSLWLKHRDAAVASAQAEVAQLEPQLVAGVRNANRKCLLAFVVEAQAPTH